MTTTKRVSLVELKKYCKPFGIHVNAKNTEDNPEVVLTAPPGYQFAPELHDLVTSEWDEETFADCVERAMQDAETYCHSIVKCPDDCPCNDE